MRRSAKAIAVLGLAVLAVIMMTGFVGVREIVAAQAGGLRAVQDVSMRAVISYLVR